jgi:hypothetical protein
MMRTRNRVGIWLCWSCGVCLVGLCITGFLSSKGNVWEKLTIVCAFGMLASVAACLGFVVVTVLRLRNERRNIRRRTTLSDEEFAARLSRTKYINPQVVRRVRELAAERFRSIHGDKFYPEDRFEDDLHFSDSFPFGTEQFYKDLMEFLDVDEGEPAPEFRGIITFGDLVKAANDVWQRKHTSTTSSATG